MKEAGRDGNPGCGPVGRFRAAHAVGMAALGVLLCAPARAATTRSVQSGTASSTANGTLTVTIAAVDTTKAALFFSCRHGSNRPVGSTVRGKLSSATTIDFVRSTDEASPATIGIQWYVVEFATGVSVQRGEVAQSATTVNVTITAVAAVAQAFVTYSMTPTSTDSAWGADDSTVAELTSTTNLQFRSSAAAATHTIAWQVVEFTSAADVNVQKGSIATMTGTTLSVTGTLSPAVDTGRTFVLAAGRSSSGTNDIGARMLRARLTDSTTVTIDRAVSGKTAVSLLDAWTTGLTHTNSAGSNRLLVFAVGYEHSSDTLVSNVTYGGQGLTRIAGTVSSSAGVYARVELWYLKQTGINAASSSTFNVTWGGGGPAEPMYAAATFANVEQSTPVASSNTATTSAATPNPITATIDVEPRGYAVAGVVCGNSGTYTWNNGWTSGSDQTSGGTTELSTGHVAETTSTTDTASATHSGPNRQAMVVAYLNPLFEDELDEIVWQAVELKDGSLVQSGSASFATGVSQATASLSPSIDLAASVGFASAEATSGLGLGISPYVNDDVMGVGSATVSLSKTQVTLDRGSTVDSADVGWFVVTFRRRRVQVLP